MAKISQIPAETLQQIIASLLVTKIHVAYLVLPLFETEEYSFADLRAVSLTNRAFHVVAEPLLWRHICVGRFSPYQSTPDRVTERVVTLIKYWRARPDIAAHVQTLFVSWPAVNPGHNQLLSSENVDFLSQTMQDIGLRVDDTWHESPDNVAVVAGLAVLVTPRLKVLDTSIDRSDIFFKCIPAPGEIALRLECLKHVRVGIPGDGSLAKVFPLLRLAPSLERLDSWRPRLLHSVAPAPDMNWSNISSIAFNDANLNASEILAVVQSCRTLREFEFRPAHSLPASAPREILAALAAHAGTLRKLHVSFDNDCDLLDNPDGMGTLSAFTALEDLWITTREMGVDDNCILKALPATLLRLKLGDYPRDEHVREIEWLANYIARGGYPNLRHVQLSGWECDTDHTGPCRGTFVCDPDYPYVSDIDEHGSDWEYGSDEEEEEGCDGGKTVTDLKALLLDAGVECTIGDD